MIPVHELLYPDTGPDSTKTESQKVLLVLHAHSTLLTIYTDKMKTLIAVLTM